MPTETQRRAQTRAAGRARLETWCAARRIALGGDLAGGEVSAVCAAQMPDGTRVVVKHDPTGPVTVEARWLRRHRRAPQVIDVDETANVIVLEHIDGQLLVETTDQIDNTNTSWWLGLAADATSEPISDPAAVGLVDVRDRYRYAYQQICDRSNDRELNHTTIGEWFEWADGLDTTEWGATACDVIAKNTIVDTHGGWWAIDPLCAWAPPQLVWVPWTIDTTRKRRRGQPDTIVDAQHQMLELAPDVAGAAAWMPAGMLWTLWWCDRTRPLHRHTLDALDHWLGQWRRHR